MKNNFKYNKKKRNTSELILIYIKWISKNFVIFRFEKG